MEDERYQRLEDLVREMVFKLNRQIGGADETRAFSWEKPQYSSGTPAHLVIQFKSARTGIYRLRVTIAEWEKRPPNQQAKIVVLQDPLTEVDHNGETRHIYYNEVGWAMYTGTSEACAVQEILNSHTNLILDAHKAQRKVEEIRMLRAAKLEIEERLMCDVRSPIERSDPSDPFKGSTHVNGEANGVKWGAYIDPKYKTVTVTLLMPFDHIDQIAPTINLAMQKEGEV